LLAAERNADGLGATMHVPEHPFAV
jgi:hypothetical protein